MFNKLNKDDLLELSEIYKGLIKSVDNTDKEIDQNIKDLKLIIDGLNKDIKNIKLLKSFISKVASNEDFKNIEYFSLINDKFDLEIKFLEKYYKNQQEFIDIQKNFIVAIREERELLFELILFITNIEN